MTPTPANQPPVVLFIGPPEHGKTTARKIFCDLTKMPGASCSDVIYALLSQHKGIPESELRAFSKADIRKELIEFGDYLCGSIGKLELVKAEAPLRDDLYRGPSALFRTLYHAGFRVVDGVRRRLELHEIKDRMGWLGVPVLVVHVSDPRKPADAVKDNTEVDATDADFSILNDGTPSDLKAKLQAWIELHRPKKEAPKA